MLVKNVPRYVGENGAKNKWMLVNIMLVKKCVGEKKYVGETFRYVGEKYVGECRNLNVCW